MGDKSTAARWDVLGPRCRLALAAPLLERRSRHLVAPAEPSPKRLCQREGGRAPHSRAQRTVSQGGQEQARAVECGRTGRRLCGHVSYLTLSSTAGPARAAQDTPKACAAGVSAAFTNTQAPPMVQDGSACPPAPRPWPGLQTPERTDISMRDPHAKDLSAFIFKGIM